MSSTSGRVTCEHDSCCHLPSVARCQIMTVTAACRDKDKPRDDERMEDGYTVKYLPAELLRDLNIVDTPGTNVILERQQRLTEEYVPRADMVLFTMSAGGLPTVKPHAQALLASC